MSHSNTFVRALMAVTVLAGGAAFAFGQAAPAPRAPAALATAKPPAVGTAVSVGSDFVIGPEDVVGVLFWREADMSGDVTVRPDGRITLPLIGDLTAAGLTPETLRGQIQTAAAKYLADANVTVVVRQINSRKVFITGQVNSPGAYPLTAPRTVMQLIALAGGITEFADTENITIMRQEPGRTRSFKFNYKDVAKGKKLEQNLQLQPGDTVVVPE